MVLFSSRRIRRSLVLKLYFVLVSQTSNYMKPILNSWKEAYTLVFWGVLFFWFGNCEKIHSWRFSYLNGNELWGRGISPPMLWTCTCRGNKEPNATPWTQNITIFFNLCVIFWTWSRGVQIYLLLDKSNGYSRVLR